MKAQTENQIQADFFTWLALHEKKYPELGLFYAIPNGSHKSPAARGLFKRTGLKAGVPDVHLPIARACYVLDRRWNGYAGLWIEFKADKGRVSPIQKEWHERLEKQQHVIAVCRSWTEAANVVIDYLNLPLPRFNEMNLSEQQNGRRG
jgi:hypothetical protein